MSHYVLDLLSEIVSNLIMSFACYLFKFSDRANADIAARFRAELDSLFSHEYDDTDTMDTPAALDDLEPDPPAPEPVTTPQDAGDLGLFPDPDPDDRDQPDLGDDDWDDLL
ncbi:MAG: hypothetical protein DUD31_10890 [Coriobacteriaceae bacterium]|nr:MAG: hypothetical protein DUD31_10890 [Coriobacteriaceae bacterium]